VNYQRNTMRYPGVVKCGQSATEPQLGRRPMNGGCGCDRYDGDTADNAGERVDCLRGMSLAMVYSPCQEFEDLYDHTEGLKRGTIFRALDKPFTGKGGRHNG